MQTPPCQHQLHDLRSVPEMRRDSIVEFQTDDEQFALIVQEHLWNEDARSLSGEGVCLRCLLKLRSELDRQHNCNDFCDAAMTVARAAEQVDDFIMQCCHRQESLSLLASLPAAE